MYKAERRLRKEKEIKEKEIVKFKRWHNIVTYWVPFGNEEHSAYHICDWDGVKFPVKLVNGQWYQLTWGTSGYHTSSSSMIIPYAYKELGLGWYCLGDPEYEVLVPAPPENNPQLRGAMPKGAANMHSPREM